MRLPRFLLKFLPAAALATAPAWAEETAAAKAGLPQMDTTFYPSQIFWLVVAFGALYFLLSRFAIPSISSTQEKRRAKIEGDLKAAADANEAAKKAMEETGKILADARARAQAIVSENIARSAKVAQAHAEEQKQELMRHAQHAEARIRVARDAAMHDVRTTANELAGAIVEKVAGLKLQARP